MPADQAVFIRVFGRTFLIATVVTLATLALGARFSARLRHHEPPARRRRIRPDSCFAALLDVDPGAHSCMDRARLRPDPQEKPGVAKPNLNFGLTPSNQRAVRGNPRAIAAWAPRALNLPPSPHGRRISPTACGSRRDEQQLRKCRKSRSLPQWLLSLSDNPNRIRSLASSPGRKTKEDKEGG